MKIKTSGLILLFALGSVLSFAQNRDVDIKYRLAQSYERSGDYESAIKLYRELYAKDSLNVVIIDALRRDYMQLKRYDDAIALLHQQLKRSPTDMIVLSQLGTTYNLNSDEKDAAESWDRAIAVDPKREATYRVVANAIVESRLFEKAIDVYKRGRVACGDSNLFSTDIAYLYSIMLKYADATKEYINVVNQNPGQLSYVIARMAGYTGNTDALSAATLAVEQAAQASSNSLPLFQLLAWVYMEGKHFDKAFETYKTIDAKSNAGGNEIYNFGERALNERANDVAEHAFLEVINHYPKFVGLALAKFGYARSLEARLAREDTSGKRAFMNGSRAALRSETDIGPLYLNTINAYRKVIGDYPSSELAAKSLLRIATLQQERLFDLNGAQLSLENLLKNYPTFLQQISDANLRLGDVFLLKGDLQQAEAQYSLLTQNQIIIGDDREKAALHLAELDYFKGDFKNAATKLQQLAKNANSDIANDALKLQIFIQDNLESGEPVLKEYAKGELLQRQQKLSEALVSFQAIATKDTSSTLVDECLMNEGMILTMMQRYQEAIDTYRRLIDAYPESIVLDLALINAGTAFEVGLHDKQNAILTYERLLKDYPNSIYANEARKRVRELRGDTL